MSSQVLATYPSSSNPTKSYDIVIANEGTPQAHLYCNCPAWRNQKAEPAQRTCKHLIAFGTGSPTVVSTAHAIMANKKIVVADEFEAELQRAAESLSKLMK